MKDNSRKKTLLQGVEEFISDGFLTPSGVVSYAMMLFCLLAVCLALYSGWYFAAAGMLGLFVTGGLLLAGTAKRLEWQRKYENKITKLEESNERLMREVSRNRDELGTIGEIVMKGKKASLSPDSSPAGQRQKTSGGVVSSSVMVADNTDMRLQAISVRNDNEKGGRVLTPPPSSSPAVVPLSAPAVHAKESGRKRRKVRNFSGKYSDSVTLEIVKNALQNNKVETFIQPIVTIPQRKTVFFEMFSKIRTRPGKHLDASEYIEVAKDNGLSSEIDNMLLTQCLKTVRQCREDSTGYFLNITSATLQDKSYMMDLLAFVKKNRGLASKLIFEFSQSDVLHMKEKNRALLGAMAKTGCRFSMDCVSRKITSVGLLKRTWISFVKIDASWITSIDAQTVKVSTSRDIGTLKHDLENAGISIIAEKIEEERTLLEILDHDIEYGQGFLFGEPSSNEAFVRKQAVRRRIA